MAMEAWKQEQEVSKTEEAGNPFGWLGNYIKQAPGYKAPKQPAPKFSSGLLNGRAGDAAQVDLTPSKVQGWSPVPKPTATTSKPITRPNLPSKTSGLDKGQGHTPSSSSKVPAIQEGLGKIENRGTYATSSSNTKPTNKRAAPSESTVNGFPITNNSKKAKTADTRKAQRPPPAVEEKVVAIPNRWQRAQAGNGVVQPVKPATYGRNGTRQNGTQAMKATKGKGAAKKDTPAKLEVITLDEDSDEDDDPKEVHQQTSEFRGTNADREIEAVFSASGKVDDDVQHRLSPEKPAMASQVESIESASGTGEVQSPIVSMATNILPAPPPLDEDSSIGYNGTSVDQPWEASGFAIMPMGTGAGPSEPRRSRSASPPKSKQGARCATSPSGPGPQSHIVYSDALPTERTTARSPSPDLHVDVEPVPDDTVGRPEWINDPPQIDQDDLGIYREIPQHLRMSFVALADELDAIDEPSRHTDLSMAYLDFRRWANQGVPAYPGGPNLDLNMRHVVAAQMVWRALRSSQILREEAQRKPSAGRQDLQQESDAGPHPESSRGSETSPRVQDQTASSSEHVNSTPNVLAVSSTNGKLEIHALPDTPKNRPPIDIGESPEFIEQPAPPRNVERIGRFESPDAERKQVQADLIESPEQSRTGFRAMSINSDVECMS